MPACPPAHRSGGILGGSAWSWAAIPLIYVALVLLRTASYALFNATAFAWLRESERAAGGARGLAGGRLCVGPPGMGAVCFA